MNRVRRKCLVLGIAGICLVAHVAEAQGRSGGGEVPGEERKTFFSERLGEERELIVYLPDDYASSPDSYPVLYMLDAHDLGMARSESVLRGLQGAGRIPKMIVVGIVNTKGNRDRDMLPVPVPGRQGSGGADRFLSFLEHEVKPLIRKDYRAGDESTIVGYSNSAFLVVYCLLQKPALFDNYIASSPMLGYGREMILEKAAAFLDSESPAGRALFVIYGGRDPYPEALDTTPDLDAMVRSKQPEGFRYECVFLKEEGHIPASTLERGIVWTCSRDGTVVD